MSTEILREYALQIVRTPTLTARESFVVESLGRGETLQKVGDGFGVTRERIRKVGSKALKKFRSWAKRSGAEGLLRELDIPIEIPHWIGREPWPARQVRLCEVEGCVSKHYSAGMCERHHALLEYRTNPKRRALIRRATLRRYYRICRAVAPEDYDNMTFVIGKERWPSKGRRAKCR